MDPLCGYYRENLRADNMPAIQYDQKEKGRRPKQEGTRTRQARPLHQLLAMRAQGEFPTCPVLLWRVEFCAVPCCALSCTCTKGEGSGAEGERIVNASVWHTSVMAKLCCERVRVSGRRRRSWRGDMSQRHQAVSAVPITHDAPIRNSLVVPRLGTRGRIGRPPRLAGRQRRAAQHSTLHPAIRSPPAMVPKEKETPS